jgi:hypothetical protein
MKSIVIKHLIIFILAMISFIALFYIITTYQPTIITVPIVVTILTFWIYGLLIYPDL